jgi:hypothetical protein
MSSPGSLGRDTSATADKTSQQFDYPDLDFSKSEFRLLHLRPGLSDDRIVVKLLTFPLYALPLSFKDEEHLTQLNEVYQALSTAMSQRIGFQFAELLRWQCLYDELDELYLNRSLAELARNEHFESQRATHNVGIQENATMLEMRGMKDAFITLVDDYQGTTSDHFETVEFQGLIGHLRSNDDRYSRTLTLTPDYEAVSYFCGEQTKDTHIMLNDTSVKIPATTAHALRGLRREDEWRILWIDALCIDQGNQTGRAHQVLRLSNIYSCATRTLVWLGDEDETLNEDFSTCFKRIRESEESAESVSLDQTLPKGAKFIFRHHGRSTYSLPASTDTSASHMRVHRDAVSAIVALLSKYLKRP